jgi:hypothetical protein
MSLITQNRDRVAYSIREARLATGLSSATIHKLCNEGHLTRRKVGKRTFILADELDCYLRSRPSAKWPSGKRS